jgi:APA family basic amino acid/polyamine antiporter
MGLFTIKPALPDAHAAAADQRQLGRTLGATSLVVLGVSSSIGAGLFVLTGTAAAHYAGPAVALSYLVAGLGCLCAGLCYAEFAALSPRTGSAYSYAYATMGELVAWIIGWDMVLEFLFSGVTVAVGWSGYFCGLLSAWGVHVPDAFATSPLRFDHDHRLQLTGAVFNLPAAVLIALETGLLYVGMRESARFLSAVVALLLAVIALIVVASIPFINPLNWHPFVPQNTGTWGRFGWSGVMTAAAVVFFAYTGFESVSVATREARVPSRDIPIGVLGSFAVCAVAYVSIALVMTGLARYTTLAGTEPMISALANAGPGLAWLIPIVSVGIVFGLAAAPIGSLYAQSRILFAMAEDGLLPGTFAAVHPSFKTPHRATAVVGLLAVVTAGLLPLELLGELVSIGTLLAFVIVCASVLILRARKPNIPRPFRTPGSPYVPALGILTCVYMMLSLPTDTWIRLGIWLVVGLLLYALFGYRHSRAAKEQATQSS